MISGAGIAGPVAAYWLAIAGHPITIIEKAPRPRLGGQNIDISDAAVDIVKMMGIEDEILRHNTTEKGLQIVNEKNEVQAAFPKGSPIGFTSKYEILRGDLAGLLGKLTSSSAEYRFDCSVKEVEEREDALTVTFAGGDKERFDLLICAEGVSSATRKLIFGTKDPYKYLGVYTSYMTLPRRSKDRAWARWFNAPEGRVILLRPDNHGTTRASLNVWHDGPAEAHFSQAEARAWIRDKLAGAGWEAPRISKDLGHDHEIYLGPVSQVRMKRWSKGRCVLLGDAAYCPTPFTGMGTTLAIIGAYVLAGEISAGEEHQRALARYEEILRPFVERVQKVFPGQFRLAYPRSKGAVNVFNKILSVFASPLAQRAAAWAKKRPKEFERNFTLPNYAAFHREPINEESIS